jgi:short-subunit dehydrogenase
MEPIMSEPRWTLITGASSGIGAELARAFGAEGDALVLTARRRDRLEALAAELPGRVEIITADLEEPDAPAELLAEVERRGIALHTLVNNAGFGLRGRFHSLPAERQFAMVDLNIAALTKLSRLVLPGLYARKQGGILNVASTAAFQAGPKMAVYYATKAYVLHFSEALHEEAKEHSVTVTALCPGPTNTEFASVADMESSRLFRFGAMDAASVARAGLAGYRAGRAIVVPGGSNRFAALMTRFVPRAMVRRIAGKLQG